MTWFDKDTMSGSPEIEKKCRDAVKETMATDRINEVESITIEGDRGKIVISGRENIWKFLEKFSK